eukprot:EG_transcript_32327
MQSCHLLVHTKGSDGERLEGWYHQHPDSVARSSPAAEARLATARLLVDRRACDTLTNFTTLAPLLSSRRVTSCTVVTDAYHMRRAWWCGSVVLAAEGIAIDEAVCIQSANAPTSESPARAVRDFGRAVLWVLTRPLPGGPCTLERVTR